MRQGRLTGQYQSLRARSIADGDSVHLESEIGELPEIEDALTVGRRYPAVASMATEKQAVKRPRRGPIRLHADEEDGRAGVLSNRD